MLLCDTLLPHLLQVFRQELGVAIQECLILMAAAYRGVEGQDALAVEALILRNIDSVSDLEPNFAVWLITGTSFLSCTNQRMNLLLYIPMYPSLGG